MVVVVIIVVPLWCLWLVAPRRLARERLLPYPLLRIQSHAIHQSAAQDVYRHQLLLCCKKDKET